MHTLIHKYYILCKVLADVESSLFCEQCDKVNSKGVK